MDSKLVVEQMSGRWKIKHPDMRPLADAGQAAGAARHDVHLGPAGAEQARRPAGSTRRWTACGAGGRSAPSPARPPRPTPARSARTPTRGWSAGRHRRPRWCWCGTASPTHTVDKRFSGGLGGSNPGLTDEGRAQVRATADWLAPLADGIDAVVTSPVRRTRESAEILAERLGPSAGHRGRAREMEFGTWDGLTFAEVRERYPDELDAWLGSLDARARAAASRSGSWRSGCWPACDRLLAEHAGQTVLVVSHVTPIKMLVAHALGAPLEAVFRMELAPASVTVLSFFADDGLGRSGQRRRCGCSTRGPTDARRSQVADDHVEPGAVPAGRSRLDLPAEAPRWSANRAGRAGRARRPPAGRARAGPWSPC